MPAVVVSNVTIPVVPGSIRRERLDGIDRGRAFDLTYRASVTGSPKRDWFFSTPPVLRSAADTFEGLLSQVGPLACSGDLIGSSSNLALWSEQQNNGVYTLTGVTIQSDIAATPNGTVTGDKIWETAVTSQHSVTQTVTCAIATYVFSVWLNPSERTKAVVGMYDGVLGVASTGVDLSNGTLFNSGLAVGAWTNISATISANFGGWYRVTLVATRGAGTVTTPAVYAYTTAVSYLGDVTKGLYSWGWQLEAPALPVASAYARTTSAAVNLLTTNCYPEITGWTPIRTPDGHRVVLEFVLHEQ